MPSTYHWMDILQLFYKFYKTRAMLSTSLSSLYSRGRPRSGRRIHLLCYMYGYVYINDTIKLVTVVKNVVLQTYMSISISTGRRLLKRYLPCKKRSRFFILHSFFIQNTSIFIVCDTMYVIHETVNVTKNSLLSFFWF